MVQKYFPPTPEWIVVLTPHFGDHCSRIPTVLPKWLYNIVGKTCTQFCNCQHFFTVTENAKLTLQIMMLLNYAITFPSILWMNQATMK